MDRCPEVGSAVQEELRGLCRKLVLASQSPNRRRLLEDAGLNVITRPQDIFEICGFTEPAKVVTTLSSQKMDSYLGSPEFDPSLPAVAVDTLVSLDGKLLGKPAGDNEARTMLRALSGRWHEVYSGMSVYVPGLSGVQCVCDVTRVLFRTLDDADVKWYISTGDCNGAAGAYKIQRNGYRLIDEIDGSFSNIIGLPLERLVEILSGAVT